MAHDESEVRFTEPQRIRNDRFEHRLYIDRRARDDAQNFGGRGLLLKSFGERLAARIQQLVLNHPPKLLPARRVLRCIRHCCFCCAAAQDWRRALAMSALFGLLAYVTYEMTNLSTLKG